MPRTKGSGIGNSFCRDRRKRRRIIVQPGLGGKAIRTDDLVPIYPVLQVPETTAPEVPETTVPLPDPPCNDPCSQPSSNNQNPAKNRTHQQRKKSESAGWIKAFPEMKDAYLQSMAPLCTVCRFCTEPTETDDILLCPDCGSTAYYCTVCFHQNHRFSQLHVPVIWVGTMYLPYVWDKHLALPPIGKGHTHHVTVTTRMTIIDQYGRQHKDVDITFCNCLTKVAALVQLGLWPATPQNPVTAIDLRFMELCRCMLLDGAVAVYKFASIMRMYIDHLPHGSDQVDMYKSIATDTTAYHRRFAYDINYLQGIVPDFPDGSSCPVCVETEHALPKVISMDGNFRLVRKKSAGTSVLKPHHQGRFFLEKEEVDPFLKTQALAHDLDCSDFKAGTPSRAAFKADKLDVTGTFGSICIHDYPELFINMDSGEKLGYAVSIIKKLQEKSTDLKVLYDVACRLRPQLEAAEVDFSKLDLAVGVFHGFAHNVKCNMEYNPKNKADFRLADGENTERLWSQIGNFVYIQKEMSPSNRHDLLVDALLHWGEKSVDSIAHKLKMRLKNARDVEWKSHIELEKILQPFKDQGHDVSHGAIEDWEVQIKDQYARNKEKSVTKWEMDYAVMLKKWYSIRWQVAGGAFQALDVEAQAELTSLEARLRKIEKGKKFPRWSQQSPQFKRYLDEACTAARDEIVGKMHQEAVDRAQLISLKKRARGNEVVVKLSKQVQKTNLKLKALVKHYNAIHGITPISFDDIKDHDSDIYSALPSINHLPFPVLREAIRFKNTLDRVEEEVSALKVEFPAVLYGYEKLNIMLKDELMLVSPPNRGLQQGVFALILKKILETEKRIEILAGEIRRSLLCNVITDNHYTMNMPCQYMPHSPVVLDGEEEVAEEKQPVIAAQEEEASVEQQEYGYHPSDDEVPTDDEL